MSLYVYKKKEIEEKLEEIYTKDSIELRLENEKNNNINLWSSAGESYSLFETFVNSTKLTNILVPMLFISVGGYFIFKHISPEIKYRLEKSNGLVSQGTVAAVDDDYIDISKYISNPSGLAEVSTKAFEEHVLLDDEVSKNYNGIFFITIPSLGINKMPVTANVDSTTEESYMSVLNTTLAHFENTGLPISPVKNNIVIYGHSATPNYGPRITDPMVAFSFLPNLKVGDDIILEIEGQTYNFKMQRSKIVEPTDTSIITGAKGKRTLTLFTCYPAGNNAKRYVAVAREV